ncbi:type II secretion system protein [Actinomadura craniellae]|uniref:Type II secretion system protein n=1 Tax=Actinomadura craniellae TaxID=2231787 RepID=A0A365GZ97_9ACTN|nr:type II secretion system F family protein [Actinomadura craniellae]RAY12164.1 type II secretion system protein [Actinomadura craniellae]
MNAALIAGGLVGLGVFALVRALFPSRPGLASRLAAFDARASRQEDAPRPGGTTSERFGGLRARLGTALARFYASQGWEQRTVRADLALLDRSFEAFLATKFLLPAGVLVLMPLLAAYCALLGIPVVVPVWLGLVLAGVFFFFPDMQLRQEAAVRRRDFRHVVGAFLDLVAMNLSGGRGVPEALMTASQIGDSWPLRRIREALTNARITGQTPWQALGTLGDEVNVAELRDLAAALTLVADDGAKIRQSLTARAASMRSREVSELEGKAGERSQSMLVAQLLLCAAFLIFLTYPAVTRLLTA